MTKKNLWPILATLKENKFIDLTHSFYPGIPHAPDMPDQTIETIYDFDKDGFKAHRYSHVGQWGTHVDPPIHFARNGRTLDQIRVTEMLLPLVCFDCIKNVQHNPDYIFNLGDLEAWEKRNGDVPGNAFVIMKTGWSKRWPSSDLMTNKDAHGVAHFPGWGKDVVEFLINTRKVTAFGHETTDTDGGLSISRDDFTVERTILENDCYQIELLGDTSDLVEAGGIAVVTFPKPKDGSGFPARVFAICPN